MSSRSPRVPSYRLHKPTGLAVVRLNGRDFYLGKHGTPASHERYERLIAEWLSTHQLTNVPDSDRRHRDYLVDELFVAYWDHARRYYVKNGKPTSTQQHIQDAFKPVHEMYGSTPAADFGPLALKTVREAMIERNGWSRTTINKAVGTIRRMFKWAAENELISANVYHGLQTVSGLKQGRSTAREPKEITPVPDEHVGAVLPFLSHQLGTMIELQKLTGMRPTETVMMRGIDIDTSGHIWTYIPESHKTEHHGKNRTIYLGPRAQEVIRPFLKRDLSAYLFSPAEAMAERNAKRRADRKSPMTPSQAMRMAKARPRRTPRARYDRDSYRRAIHRACDKAAVPRWSPNQLRHATATFLRKEYGIDAARVILGHTSPATTEVYAELDRAKAIEIMGKVG